MNKTYNHRQAVGKGNQVSTTIILALLSEIAERRRSRSDLLGHASLVVFEAEFASVLADDANVLPAKPLETLLCYLAEGRGEVDEVNAGEEGGDVDEMGHGLNVPASAASNLFVCRLVSNVSCPLDRQ